MANTAELTGVGARAELRTWYLGRLRPRLEDAVAAGTVERDDLRWLDVQLSDFFEQRENVPEESA